ncbi:glycosyltransferase family 2 protein [Thetidibacter halocola]|uniref:Glycosyltransferase n=1 Tax=Thetidibacter halocola TaxID=2827239 RepID=A0A8J7WDQ2_9RHOB|nr:glycosyltransferase family 2 protein [Thetidibacter halocola]MBS0124529.1 glycosyltransferase [Thetidibacter halocola]
MNQQAQILEDLRRTSPLGPRDEPLSRILLDAGALSPQALLSATAEAARLNRPLAQVIEAEDLLPLADLLDAQAQRHGVPVLRRDAHPPDETALAALPARFCLDHAVLPWFRRGDTLVLATARPDDFPRILTKLPPDIGPVTMAITSEAEIHTTISESHGTALARGAETLRPAADSCRDLVRLDRSAGAVAAVALVLSVGLLALAPQMFFGGALALALGSLIVAQGMKLAALVATLRRPLPAPPDELRMPPQPPVVTLLVPLYRERAIARALVARLSRLTYPRTLLDVILILEEHDDQTRAALAEAHLPRWIRTLEVPQGQPMTKPRALNYALNFARGTIIGIYDAEDAPAPDQVDRVVAHFAQAPRDVACLQGVLDFYNPRANWLSRCFAIEYASWFRVLLPGLVRLGLAVPLGGTTVFLRRDALEAVGGWDAHNVTEDADLGMLLARRGYRTDVIPTVTREEANNRAWPWIRQRSRWLKGYAITWWVHSRHPRALWRDLGPWRFFGVQTLFLATLAQFVLAPVLWSFWLILLGLPHPLDGVMSDASRRVLIGTFLSAEAISLAFGIIALARSPHRRLIPWVPTLFLYFPLGTFAIYKALWEVLRKPFYWDKTDHGHSAPDGPGADLPRG